MKTTTFCLGDHSSFRYGLLITLLAGWCTDVFSIPILDQSQTSLGTGEFVQGTIEVAQTFTPSITGDLATLNLVLNRNNFAETEPLIVSIYNTQAGNPYSVLGTTSLNDVSADFFATYSINFSSLDIGLAANTQYAIVLTAPGTFNGFYVRGSVDDTYPGGETLTEASAGAPWLVDTRERDFAFQTYMEVPDSTGLGVLVIASLGLLSFGYFQRRKRGRAGLRNISNAECGVRSVLNADGFPKPATNGFPLNRDALSRKAGGLRNVSNAECGLRSEESSVVSCQWSVVSGGKRRFEEEWSIKN